MAAPPKHRRTTGAARVPHDFKNHSPASGTRVAPWLWLLLGLGVGLLVALIVFLRTADQEVADRMPSPAARIGKGEEARDVRRPADRPVVQAPAPRLPASEGGESPYRFYTRLREQGVEIPAREIRELQPATPTSPPPPRDVGSYVLQAGSFRTAAQADQLRARLILLGLQPHVEIADSGDRQWHRVRLGPFEDTAALNRTRARLTREGIASVAMRVD